MKATVSLDLDNQWSYMKTHGDEGWEDFPSYFDVAIPRILDALDDLGIKITFFIVGKDASLEKNRAALQMIPARGHEIANHSFMHEPWLHLYSEEEVVEEISSAEDAIREATGVQPRGWRGPGFSCSPTVLQVLKDRGYQYDASQFPTYLGPVARAYYLLTSGLSKEEKADRKQLYGKLSDGLGTLRPNHDTLLRIPVTTMPIIKTPIHLSYLLYLATFSPLLAKIYFGMALKLCRLFRIEPSLLLHPTDFLGGDDVPELSYFPAMNRDGEWKVAQTSMFLKMLGAAFEIQPMSGAVPSIAEEATQSYDTAAAC